MTTLCQRRRSTSLALTSCLFGAALIAGCAHHAPATIHDNTTVISGRNTAHTSPADARRTVLVEAAAITVDHGYRFFKLMTPIMPGTDVAIHLYGQSEINAGAPNVYDADAIAAGQLSKTGAP